MLSIRNILLAASAGVLLWLAVPNFLAAAWMAVGQPIVNDIEDGKQPSAVDLETLVESRSQAYSITNFSEYATGLAVALVIQDDSPENIEKALALLRVSTQQAPMNAFSWQWRARLANFSPNAEENEAVTAWRTARMLAEFDRHIFYDRIHLGTVIYRKMEPQDHELLREDVERAYRENRGRLRAYAKKQDILEWMKYLLRDQDKTKYLSS